MMVESWENHVTVVESAESIGDGRCGRDEVFIKVMFWNAPGFGSFPYHL